MRLIPHGDLGRRAATALWSGKMGDSDAVIFKEDVMSDFKMERINMVESQIRPNAVTDSDLLKALLDTPREIFVPPSLRALAYMDGGLCVEAARDHRPARHMLSPMVFAKLAQLARIRKTDRVLDIGGTAGYSAAILSRLAGSVVALENDAGLTALAKESLSALGAANVTVVMGPLEAGSPENAPFDAIFLNGRVGNLSEPLLSQLAEGGRLVGIMGSDTAAKAKLFLKIASQIQERSGFDASAPVLPGFASKHAFVF